MLTFCFSPGACSTASHIALEEAGAPYVEQRTSIEKGENKTEEYLRINPRAKVPALIIDGAVLTENTAILAYIAKRFSASNLMPSDPLEEAQCISIMAWLSNTVHPAFTRFRHPARFTADPTAQSSVKEMGRITFWSSCQEIDAQLAGKNWMVGKAFSVADCYALVFYAWGLISQLPMEELPNFTAFKARMLQRPAVRKVLESEKSVLVRAAV